MKTIKDLFIEEQSYVVEHKLNDNYYSWIEALSENGCTLTSSKFDERMLEDNILVELHKMDDYDNPVCEWYNCCKFNIDTTVEHLEKVMEYAIERYESEQGDED